MAQPHLEQQNLLDVQGLKKYFSAGKSGLLNRKESHVKAVDGVSFHLKKGETLGIVGESGCGKSTMGRALLRLYEPTDGKVYFEGKELRSLSRKQLREKRKDMQVIFQDPYGSLNQRMTVGNMLAEIVSAHKIVPKKEIRSYVVNLLEEVGLAGHFHDRFPHEFSGGQRQRVGIARALCLNPKLIVCDEAVSALDVSVQSQILNLLQRLKREHKLTYLFISHDLSVVKHISDRVAVMYLGKIVELAPKEQLYGSPQHPYTQALLSAIPSAKKERKRDRIILSGDVPSPLHVPSGCRFHTRCPIATERCRTEEPAFREVGDQQYVACHFA